MVNKLSKFVRDLRVPNKLLLIYLLDLSAVILITSILVSEKYISIDFTRKEIAGNKYIAEIAHTIEIITKNIISNSQKHSQSHSPVPDTSIDKLKESLVSAENRFGMNMESSQLNSTLINDISLLKVNSKNHLLHLKAVQTAGGLVTRIGDNSNLILDPDLDSYYTMSITVLRFPQILNLLTKNTEAATGKPDISQKSQRNRTIQLLVLEGELTTAIKTIVSDYEAAYRANRSGILKNNLGNGQEKLIASLNNLAEILHHTATSDSSPDSVKIIRARNAALENLFPCWKQSSIELETLLKQRVEAHFERMAIHLGLAFGMLVLVLLLVYYIARQITGPLKNLAKVTEDVQASNNYQIRAIRQGDDEIGQLVTGFNSMLERLDADRIKQQELIASKRAAEAQQELFESIPLAITVTSLDGNKVFYLNQSAAQLFSLRDHNGLDNRFSPFNCIADVTQRNSIIDAIAQNRPVDEYELLLRLPDEIRYWVQVSARPVHYMNENVLLMTFTPINHIKRLENVLLKEKTFSKAALESMPGIFFMLNDESRLLTYNHNFEAMILDKTFSSANAAISSYFPEEFGESIVTLTKDGFSHGSAETEIVITSGSSPVVLYLIAKCFSLEGDNCLIVVGIDISARREAEKELELWARVFECTSEGILITDADKNIISVNHALCNATGYKASEILGQKPSFISSDLNDEYFFRQIWRALRFRGSWQGEFWSLLNNGEVRPEWMVVNTMKDKAGDITNYIALFTDITEQKEQEKKIQHIAHHDPLTNLPNRLLFTERLIISLQHADRNNRRIAILYIDLDRFKTINDSLGHHIGDMVLVNASKRLTASIRDGDTVSRIGGDEFIVILNDIEDPNQISKILDNRLLPLMRQPYDTDGYELHCSCSIGISIFPEDGHDKDTLIRNADAAMYLSKEIGRNSYHFYTEELNNKAMERLNTETDLRHALDRNEFILHYQPQLNVRSGKITGAEALLRWNHPVKGIIPPMEFIPVAEESGLIVPIGMWVIREACRQVRHWDNIGLMEMRIAINVSAIQFREKNFSQELINVLKEEEVQPCRLELELTETILLEDVVKTIRIMEELKDLGFIFAIDDFGIGYSSLNYLHRFPIDRLKIDKSFINGILENPKDLAITKSIIGLGHTLELNVIAEGVENVDEFNALRAAGCDEIQGYYICRPLTADKNIDYILSNFENNALSNKNLRS